MNEKELSALIDSLIQEDMAKHPENYRTAETEAEPSQEAEPSPDAGLSQETEPSPTSAASRIPEPQPEIAEMPMPVLQAPEPEFPAETEEALAEESEPETPEPEPEAAPEEMPHGRLYAALNVEPEPEDEPPLRQKSRTRDVLAGVLLVLLAAYGVYALVLRGIDYSRSLRSDDTQRIAAEECILPLAVTDMPEFSDPGELSDDQFLTAAIWAMITEEKLSAYPASFEMRTVPAADLIAEGNRLFAVNRSPECRTIGFSGDLRFYYDAETESYLLPEDPELFTYVPAVREMTETGSGQYLVTADYLAEQPSWKTAEPAVIKTMQFTMQQGSNGWQIRAAKQIS